MERRVPEEGFLLGPKVSTYDLNILVFYAMIHQAKEDDKMLPFKEGVKAALAGKPRTLAYINRFLNGDLKEYLANRPQNSF